MANRYWIGGTGNWTDTAHWAATSGGTGGETVPTSADDIFIDSSSGLSGGTITLPAQGNCNNFLSNSGLSYTINDAMDGWNVYGNFTLEAGITFAEGSSINFDATELGKTITTAGVDFKLAYFYGAGGWTLQDDLTITGQFSDQNGTFDANDHNVTANDFYFYGTPEYIPTVVMGSGTWEVTGNDSWYVDEYEGGVVTITPETSTIKFTGTGGSLVSLIDDSSVNGGKTYNNVWFAIDGVDGTIWGSNTFNDLKVNAGQRLLFQALKTQTVSRFTAIGEDGNLITLDTQDGDTGDQFTLSKSSGTVNCDYLNISNSNVTGGSVWYAGENSLDTTNNDGWIFTDYWTNQTKNATSFSNASKNSTSFSNSAKSTTVWDNNTKH